MHLCYGMESGVYYRLVDALRGHLGLLAPHMGHDAQAFWEAVAAQVGGERMEDIHSAMRGGTYRRGDADLVSALVLYGTGPVTWAMANGGLVSGLSDEEHRRWATLLAQGGHIPIGQTLWDHRLTILAAVCAAHPEIVRMGRTGARYTQGMEVYNEVGRALGLPQSRGAWKAAAAAGMMAPVQRKRGSDLAAAGTGRGGPGGGDG